MMVITFLFCKNEVETVSNIFALNNYYLSFNNSKNLEALRETYWSKLHPISV